MKRPVVLLLAAAPLLGLGATALAATGGQSRSSIHVPDGCLAGTRVVVQISPVSGSSFESLRIHAVGHEVVELTGVTSQASVTVRLPRHGGTVTIDGQTSDGRGLSISHTYNACPAVQRSAPRRPEPVTEGGGES